MDNSPNARNRATTRVLPLILVLGLLASVLVLPTSAASPSASVDLTAGGWNCDLEPSPGCSTHEPAILAILEVSIGQGYPDGSFRPSQDVTRGQMATFLKAALKLPDSDVTAFTDVAGTTHAAAIGALATAEIASGYQDGSFRPNESVTRGQMARFLANALELPEVDTVRYSDVEGTTHARAIGAVTSAGVAGGFADGSYRPDSAVTRGQMATFLARGIGLVDRIKPSTLGDGTPSVETAGGETAGALTRTAIGSPQPAGQLSEQGGTYTLSGAGADIWESSDSFEFAHQPLEGDGSLIVRITSQTDTDAWAKAGLMIRADESPGAQHVSLFQTPGNGVALQYRPLAGGATSHLAGQSFSLPSWLRLDRKGNTFKGYSSKDGLKWTLIGSVAVAMGTVAAAGLAVTSHNDGSLSSARFDSFDQQALESDEEPNAVEQVPAESSPSPDVSIGLLHTPEEVAVWRERAIAGPYRVNGDASPNSPGDWARIRQGADRFLANPGESRWNGPSQGDLSTCVQKRNDSPPVDGPSNLRDAAFVALVTGGQSERETVKRELLSQASVPGTDFSNSSRWCAGVLYDINPSFQISHWATKLLLAYDYLGRSSFTVSEQEILDQWFRNVARFIQTDLDLALGRIYVDRGNTDELAQNIITTPSCTRPHYLDGPVSCSLHRRYNNRHAANARLVGLVGVFLEDESLKRSARLFVQEYVKYGVFPEGFVSDFERWSTRNPQLGWSYGANTLAPVLIIADAFARAGDSSLYEYSTSVGALGSEGGPKDLLFAARSFGKHVDGTFRRYGTDDPSRRGDADYLIDGNFPSGSWYGVNDINFALSNVYYQDAYLKGAYSRSGAGMGGYPSRPAGGPYVIWTGEGGILPGVLFMYGQMEEKVWPYG